MKQETYYIDYGAATVYYHVTDDNTVIRSDGTAVTMPRHRLLDYLATARELGHKAGKL